MTRKYMCVLNEEPEETHGAINHPSSLRLFSLGAGHSEGIVHVALLVQNDLRTQEISQMKPSGIYDILKTL